jgi:hypothetical protein
MLANAPNRPANSVTAAEPTEEIEPPGERRSPTCSSVLPAAVAGADSAGDDESDESDMRKASLTRAARMRERARCAAILLHPNAKSNFELAKCLALRSDLGRDKVREMLNLAPRAAVRLLQPRARAQTAIDTGSEVTVRKIVSLN